MIAAAEIKAQPAAQRPLPTVLPVASGTVTTRVGVVSIAGRGEANDPAVIRLDERELGRSVDGTIWIAAAWRYRNLDAVLLGERCGGSSCVAGTGVFLVLARASAGVAARRVADARFGVERAMTAQNFALIPAGIVFPASLDASGAAARWTRAWFDLESLQAATTVVTPAEERSLTCRAAFRSVSACAEVHCRGDAAFPGVAAPADRLRAYQQAKLQGQPAMAAYDPRVVAMLPAQNGFWAACARACAAGSVRESDYRGFAAASCGG